VKCREFPAAIARERPGIEHRAFIPEPQGGRIPELADRQGSLARTSVVGISLDVTEAKRAENALRERLALIEQQQRIIRELSTPIIEVWDRVMALPMLGVIDSGRAAEVMGNLLAQVSEKGARFALIDLTSVEVVDTGTAGHILKLIHAIRLLGADGIITGIRPAVAQTMVTLGLDLGNVVTLARLRDAIHFCIQRMGTAPA
jgi:rsbT co-antagonist protein RsbR